MTNTLRYVSEEYPDIKFYFLKKQLSNIFQIHREYSRDRRWKTDMCMICDVFYYLLDRCNELVVVFSFWDISYMKLTNNYTCVVVHYMFCVVLRTLVLLIDM